VNWRGLQSFRLRIFIVTTAVVLAVLAVLGVLGWERVLGLELQRLDQRLCSEARRLPMLPPPRGAPDDLRRLEDDLVPKLRLRQPRELLLSLAVEGKPLQQSAAWPVGLDRRALRDLQWEQQPGARAGPPQGPPPGMLRPGPRGGGGHPPPMCEVAELPAWAGLAGGWRIARVSMPWAQAALAADTSPLRASMRDALVRALGLLLPLALLLTAGGAWLLATLALRPVARLQRAMDGADFKALRQRLPEAGEDREFRQLIAAYNTMLDRLHASFQQATRFSADAAHELKTPLTILQGQIERALQGHERDTPQRLAEMADEVARLGAITRKLLLLSQADAGHLALLATPLDFGAMLADLAADLRMSAPGLQLSEDIAPGLHVEADGQLLGQVLNNLASNALKYTPAGGWVRLQARALPQGGAELRLANACAPLGAAARARFFERFHRGEEAHSRSVDGHGLGLSLAREIARAHGGDLQLLPGALDEVHLCLTLPHRPPPPGAPGAPVPGGARLGQPNN
jgi:signal transduction histidine kinase